jgi:hypothetical protein
MIGEIVLAGEMDLLLKRLPGAKTERVIGRSLQNFVYQ